MMMRQAYRNIRVAHGASYCLITVLGSISNLTIRVAGVRIQRGFLG